MIPGQAPILHAAAQQSTKTYAEFLAYISAEAPSLSDWTSSVGASTGSFRFWPQASLPYYMTMYGSPWGPLSPNGVSGSYSTWAGVIWHAMPDKATFDAVRNAANQVLLRVEDGGIRSQDYPNYMRNGLYTTATSGAATYIRHVTEMLAYVPGVGPIRMQPKLGLGPEPFSW